MREPRPAPADQVGYPRSIGGVGLGLHLKHVGTLEKERPTGSQVPFVALGGWNERLPGGKPTNPELGLVVLECRGAESGQLGSAHGGRR